MNIDLFTFFVQISNFLILLFILNKVLIKPLLKSVDERRKNIIKQNEDILLKQEELELKMKLYDNKITEFENFKIEEKKKLENEIQEKRNLKLSEMQEEFKIEQEKFLDKFASEKEVIINSMSEAVCLRISDLLKKVFLDLADEHFEEKVIRKFIFQLESLNSDDFGRIKKLQSDRQIVINTAFNLSLENKDLIINFFKNAGINNNIVFEQNKDIILGIRMKADNIIINSNLQNITEQFNFMLKESL